MPAVGSDRSFENQFAFTVEIDGVTHAGFQECSELSVEVEPIPYREGGRLIPDKSPGTADIPNITLMRGAVANDSDLYDWFLEVLDIDANAGLVDPDYKRNLDIVVRDRDGTVLKRWRIKNAWPRKFVAGAWNNNTSEKTIESVELVCEGLRRVAA